MPALFPDSSFPSLPLFYFPFSLIPPSLFLPSSCLLSPFSLLPMSSLPLHPLLLELTGAIYSPSIVLEQPGSSEIGHLALVTPLWMSVWCEGYDLWQGTGAAGQLREGQTEARPYNHISLELWDNQENAGAEPAKGTLAGPVRWPSGEGVLHKAGNLSLIIPRTHNGGWALTPKSYLLSCICTHTYMCLLIDFIYLKRKEDRGMRKGGDGMWLPCTASR